MDCEAWLCLGEQEGLAVGRGQGAGGRERWPGTKEEASQGVVVILVGVSALGAGRAGKERSGWVGGEASPAGFGS